jgi:glycosyltransferase involved in cell wall biosynthesis
MARRGKANQRTAKALKQKNAAVDQKDSGVARKPRLLWANSYCLMDTSSGASISVRQILIQLQRSGYEVEIVGATTFDNPRGIERMLDVWKKVQDDAGAVVTINDGPLVHRLVRTKQLLREQMTVEESNRFYQLYVSRLDTFRPDVVFFYGGQSADLHISGEARARGVPSMAYLVNAHYLATRWCRDVDLIVTDTQATSDFYASRIGFRPVPVGKFIDPADIIAPQHKRRHITLINPSWAKGAGIVALLAMQLEERRPDIVFEVVESRGSWKDVVRTVTQQFEGVARDTFKNVIVTPNTSRMADVYARSRLVLGLSQWWESGSRVLAEAMLNGIPAIVSNRGGSPEMVGEGGIVVDLPPECHEAPYTTLPKPERLNQIVELIEKVWDDEVFYLMLMTRALHQGMSLHQIARSTDRLIAALKRLTDRRAGDNDYARLLTALHKHGLTEGAPAAVPEVRMGTTTAPPRRTDRQWPHEIPRICVLTLNSGEPQLEACRASLERQDLPLARHEVITGLPNKEAHDTLYAFVMDHSDDFDIFVKLDADMVPRSANFTKAVAARFAAAPDLDHMVIPVHDWLSQSLIEGIHCFSRSANWPASPSERLFVDPDPVIPGVKHTITPSLDLLVDHMPVPTLAQAFYYGVHRGLKITQTDRAADEGRRAFHLDIFRNIKAEYLRTKDSARLAALWGLVCALDDPLGHLERKMGEFLYPGKYDQLASDPRHVRNLVLARLAGTIDPGAPHAGPADASLLKIGALE